MHLPLFIRQYIWISSFVLLSFQAGAQAMPKGSLFFDQLVEYQFVDTDGKKYDFQILLNTKTGLWGFDKTMSNATGWGEDLDFVTASSDGIYTFYGKSPETGKMKYQIKQNAAAPQSIEWQRARQLFFATMKPVGKIRRYQTLNVQDYKTKAKNADGSEEQVSVAKVTFNTYPLYLFNRLEGDAKLPCSERLNFSNSLSPNELLVESVLQFPAEKLQSSLKLTFYTPTEYYFNTKGYKESKKAK